MWIVHTNEHPRGVYVSSSIPEARIKERQWEYIREKRKRGTPHKDIIYCWSRVYTSGLP